MANREPLPFRLLRSLPAPSTPLFFRPQIRRDEELERAVAVASLFGKETLFSLGTLSFANCPVQYQVKVPLGFDLMKEAGDLAHPAHLWQQ